MKLRIERETLLSVLIGAATKDPRYCLKGVCFLPDGKVAATNGHMLVWGEHENKLKTNVIISVGKLHTKSFSYAVFDTKDGIVRLFSADDSIAGVALCSVIDAKYPDINRVINNVTNADEKLPPVIGINAGYLAKLEKIANIVNPRWPAYEIRVKKADEAVLFNVIGSNEKPVSALIMPMRL